MPLLLLPVCVPFIIIIVSPDAYTSKAVVKLLIGEDLLPQSKSDDCEDFGVPSLPAPTYHFGPKYLGVMVNDFDGMLIFPDWVSLALTIKEYVLPFFKLLKV